MKKTMLVIVLTFIFLRCLAPTSPTEILIFKEDPIYEFNLSDPVARAFAYTESRFLYWKVNKHSKARGLMQITPIMIKEVNKILRKIGWNWKPYTWNDAFDPKKSIDMWYIVQNYHNPEYFIDEACRIWFGRGVQYDGMRWEDYYELIMDRL